MDTSNDVMNYKNVEETSDDEKAHVEMVVEESEQQDQPTPSQMKR